MPKENTLYVGFDETNRSTVVAWDVDDFTAGHKEIGSFKVPIDPVTGELTSGDGAVSLSENGEHIFIVEAKKILEDYGITDFDNVQVQDLASNRPQPNKFVRTIKEVEEDNRDRLEGREPEREEKLKEPKPTKGGTKGKGTVATKK